MRWNKAISLRSKANRAEGMHSGRTDHMDQDLKAPVLFGVFFYGFKRRKSWLLREEFGL